MSFYLIPLYAKDGRVRALTQVSPEDNKVLRRHRWKLTAKGYAQRERCRNGKWESVRMHRAILGLEPGDPRQGDHENGDRLDNRRGNLRIVPAKGQAQNVRRRRPDGATNRRGVYQRPSGRWSAHARLDGKQHYLGTFDTPEEAAQVARLYRVANMPYALD